MSDENTSTTLWFESGWALLFALVVGMIGLLLGFSMGLDHIRDEAVEAGYAEHYLDEDQEKAWRWLPVEDKGKADD